MKFLLVKSHTITYIEPLSCCAMSYPLRCIINVYINIFLYNITCRSFKRLLKQTGFL